MQAMILAPSRSPFIAVNIEVAIIVVPVKAVNRKARPEVPCVDHNCAAALSSGITSFEIIIALQRNVRGDISKRCALICSPERFSEKFRGSRVDGAAPREWSAIRYLPENRQNL
ncbi:hypothetical protein [Bradyrhizobium cenepequi]